jgi:hypothetical protein
MRSNKREACKGQNKRKEFIKILKIRGQQARSSETRAEGTTQAVKQKFPVVGH